MLELVDADGTVLAKSDNWRDEDANPSLLQTELAGNLALPMTSDAWGYNDVYSINRRDAALRLVLPGTAGQQRTYYIRVSGAAPASPGAAQTSGEYQLQVRLAETYEHPGSTVQYADIRYAAEGILVLGLPQHSPLKRRLRRRLHRPRQHFHRHQQRHFPNAQPVGNLLQSDQGMINVSGYMSGYTDVDWYSFTVDYQNDIERIPGVTTPGSMYPVIMDVNYADGMARPDTVLWIFDDTGTLILSGDVSNIIDDNATALQGTGVANLTQGSFGDNDPYIGPVYLPEGHTYYVAVSSKGAEPSALDIDPTTGLAANRQPPALGAGRFGRARGRRQRRQPERLRHRHPPQPACCSGNRYPTRRKTRSR